MDLTGKSWQSIGVGVAIGSALAVMRDQVAEMSPWLVGCLWLAAFIFAAYGVAALKAARWMRVPAVLLLLYVAFEFWQATTPPADLVITGWFACKRTSAEPSLTSAIGIAALIRSRCTRLDPMFVLLEDDSFIYEVNVTTDRLLVPPEPNEPLRDIVAVIRVKTKNFSGVMTSVFGPSE
jgi:hypothetical protein